MENIYYNREAEQQVLGLAISNKDCITQVCELSKELFYYPEHVHILEAIKALNDEHKAITPITINTWLSAKNMQEQAGGPAYLIELMNEFAISSHLKTYIEILTVCMSRRSQRRIAKEYTNMLDSGQNVEHCRDWAVRMLKDLRQITDNQLITQDLASQHAFDRIDKAFKNEKEGDNGIKSGISDLDHFLGGLDGSKYVAIGARPSVGKSIFALTWCVNAAKQGKRVLLISLEMDEVDITERIIANDSNISLKKIIHGKIDINEYEEVVKSLGKIGHYLLWYSLEADTIEKIHRCATELNENGGLDLIAIDYLQLMDVEDPRGYSNRQERVAAISRGIRKLSMELKIPILVLTQLNRNSVNNGFGGQKIRKREPTMSEARESGAIEQDANIFILLHVVEKEELEDPEQQDIWDTLHEKNKTMMRIIVEKNRQGTCGRATIAFDGDKMRFLTITRD